MARDQQALVAGVAPALFADALRRFGRVRLRASGRSMLPAIEPGDLLEVEYADPERIHVGDIILYDAGGRLLAHRVVTKIVDRETVRLVARGDSHWWADPSIDASRVLGRVVGISRDSSADHVGGAARRVWRGLRRRVAGLVGASATPASAL
jgi:signal peptidase I